MGPTASFVCQRLAIPPYYPAGIYACAVDARRCSGQIVEDVRFVVNLCQVCFKSTGISRYHPWQNLHYVVRNCLNNNHSVAHLICLNQDVFSGITDRKFFHERKKMTDMNGLSAKGWAPSVNLGWKDFYTRDPLCHTVSRFSANSRLVIKRHKTDFINLRDLNHRTRYHRRPGIAEICELSHPFREHKSHSHQRPQTDYRRVSSPMTHFVDDSILHHDLRPFRSGR